MCPKLLQNYQKNREGWANLLNFLPTSFYTARSDINSFCCSVALNARELQTLNWNCGWYITGTYFGHISTDVTGSSWWFSGAGISYQRYKMTFDRARSLDLVLLCRPVRWKCRIDTISVYQSVRGVRVSICSKILNLFWNSQYSKVRNYILFFSRSSSRLTHRYTVFCTKSDISLPLWILSEGNFLMQSDMNI